MQWYPWVVYLHILGAFLFFLAHGTSMMVAFRLREGIDRSRAAELLALSSRSIGIMYIGLLLLLVAGILAGFMGDHWGRGWIWAALGVLVVVMGAMYAIATPYYQRLRATAGVAPGGAQAAAEATAAEAPAGTEAPEGSGGPDDLPSLAASSRPFWLAAIGIVGLAVILWLMVLKPF